METGTNVNVIETNADKSQGSAVIELPDATLISEWFSDDQKQRLERLIKVSDGTYSVYERYNESKGPL